MSRVPAGSQAERKGVVDPKGLSLVSRMEFVARTAVEGLLSGLHPSPYFGSSVEYADHRPYTPSDEIRSIDWKLLARTDKYYVKLYEEQTNTRITVILDTSRSMAFSGSDGITKLDYGRFLAAAICYLALRQNDATGLATFDNAVRSYIPPRSVANHFRHVLSSLEAVTPGEDTRVSNVLKELAGRIPKRGIVVLISDLLDDPEHRFRTLAAEASSTRSGRVPCRRSVREKFSWEKLTRFHDIEGEGRIVANPRTIRAAYQNRFEKFLATLRSTCLERAIGYELALTDQPYDEMLSNYLARRSRLTG